MMMNYVVVFAMVMNLYYMAYMIFKLFKSYSTLNDLRKSFRDQTEQENKEYDRLKYEAADLWFVHFSEREEFISRYDDVLNKMTDIKLMHKDNIRKYKMKANELLDANNKYYLCIILSVILSFVLLMFLDANR